MILNLFGLSGGKDSTALWVWAIKESGYPPESIRGVAMDTENEYQEVYDQWAACDRFGKANGVAPIRIMRSEGFLNLAIRKKRFPGAKARFCTQVLKILPLLYFIQELWLEGFEVVSHSGVRRSESHERSMMQEWIDDPLLKSKVRRPLLNWTIQDVWDAHRRHGIPINPLYFTGRKRVGCRLCCMSNKQDVRITARTKPETIVLYRAWEKIVGGPALLSPQKNLEHGSGFFRATTVPDHLRSIKGLVRRKNSKRGKKGDTYSACTIDDVVKWSMTLRGGKQMGLDFMYDDKPIFELDDAHEPCKSGYCE